MARRDDMASFATTHSIPCITIRQMQVRSSPDSRFIMFRFPAAAMGRQRNLERARQGSDCGCAVGQVYAKARFGGERAAGANQKTYADDGSGRRADPTEAVEGAEAAATPSPPIAAEQ